MSILPLIWLPIFFLGETAEPIWPNFRGPTGDGRVPHIEHPLVWSENENVAWKTPMRGTGWSSPIIVGNRIYLAQAAGEDLAPPKNMAAGSSDRRSLPLMGDTKPLDRVLRFELVAFDLETGKPLWTCVAAETRPKIPIHPSNSFSTETPCADGERIVVFFGAAGILAAFDLEGQQLWSRTLETYPMSNGFGTGSSPIIEEGRVYLQRDNESHSELLAFDAASGETLWAVPREVRSGWSTPFLWRKSDRTDLVVCGNGLVLGLDPSNGTQRWSMTGLTSNVASSFSASPAAEPDLLFFGNSGPMSNSPLYALRATASGAFALAKGEKANDQVAWSRTGSGPGMGSPFVSQGLLYVVGDGILKVFDTATGEPVYKDRLPKGKIVVASPWGDSEHVLILDEVGQTFVIPVGRSFVVEQVNPLDDTFWASPAIAGPVLILRGVEHLYAIRSSPSAASR